MKTTVQELSKITDDFSLRIGKIPEADFSAKPLPHKWSKKEILGHLIDSAQNNLRRFICGQYEAAPPKITYQQDFWVSSNQYQQADNAEIILLWKLMNQRICSVLQQMPASNYAKQCDSEGLHSLEWLADDYVKHMKHHLNQIIPGSFDVVYR